LRDRNLLAVSIVGLAAIAAGASTGLLAGAGDGQVELGSIPATIGETGRVESVPLVPQAAGVPPLRTTTTEPAQTVGEVEEAAETEPVYTSEETYVPPEEKQPYVPPPSPEPTPDVTVGKNE
jgi:hypothetical protein